LRAGHARPLHRACREDSDVYKIRSRLINFRVTDEEMERLKSASALHGSRCLSDFARSVMLSSATSHMPATTAESLVEDRLVSMERRLAQLESALVRVLDQVEAFKPMSMRSAM
jgi:uncharacterized protein (DUF1778 family)